jgi:lipid-binding SYLF domain-containing protein
LIPFYEMLVGYILWNLEFCFIIKQAGGELTDYIIVLRTKSAVQTFSGNVHFSVGAGLSAAAGIIGRAAEADVRAGDGGYAACFTYSCSKGKFLSP